MKKAFVILFVSALSLSAAQGISTVTFGAEGGIGGSVRAEYHGSALPINSGDTVTLGHPRIYFWETPNSGYIFKQWIVNGEPTGERNGFYFLEDISGNVVVTAEFVVPVSHTITYSIAAGGIGGSVTVTYVPANSTTSTPLNSGGTVESGTNILFVAKPATGYVVKQWKRDGVVYVLSNGRVFNSIHFSVTAWEDADVTLEFVDENTPTVSAEMPGVDYYDRPSDAEVKLGEPHSFNVPASVSDGGTLSWQWYSNTSKANSGGTAISGATSASYAVPTGHLGTFFYYVVITNTNNAVSGGKVVTWTSEAVRIEVVQISSTITRAQRLPSLTPQVSVRGRTLTFAAAPSAYQIRLVDMRGKTVRRFNSSGVDSFSLSGVSAGRYIAEVSGNGRVVRSAFVLR